MDTLHAIRPPDAVCTLNAVRPLPRHRKPLIHPATTVVLLHVASVLLLAFGG